MQAFKEESFMIAFLFADYILTHFLQKLDWHEMREQYLEHGFNLGHFQNVEVVCLFEKHSTFPIAINCYSYCDVNQPCCFQIFSSDIGRRVASGECFIVHFSLDTLGIKGFCRLILAA